MWLEAVNSTLWCAISFFAGYAMHWAQDVLRDMRADVARLLTRVDNLEGNGPDDDNA